MNHIGHFIAAKITANGAFGCSFGVGGAEEVTNVGNDIFSAQSHCYDRLTLHETGNVREEWLIRDVRIVILQQFIGKLDHFDTADAETLCFQTAQNLAIETLGHAIGFEKEKGCF